MSRSGSPSLLAEYTMRRPSALKDVWVISERPAVRARAVPPPAGTAYSCSQPLFSHGNTS